MNFHEKTETVYSSKLYERRTPEFSSACAIIFSAKFSSPFTSRVRFRSIPELLLHPTF